MPPKQVIPLNAIEAEIQSRLWERTLPYIRQALLLAALLFLAFIGWDNLVDPGPEAATLVERLLAAAFFIGCYMLVAYTRTGRRFLAVIYIASVLVATVMLMWILLKLPNGYVLGHSGFLTIAMVAMIIGPRLAVSMPLVLLSLVIPNAGVFLLLGTGVETAGMPDAATATALAAIHLGAAVLALALIIVHDRLQQGTMLDNVQLEQLAGTDPLTALQNRRQLQADFNRERARQRRHKLSIGVLELDIDHFKRVNDIHGHGVGDEVLRALAKRWRSLIREIDVLARIGGEEFVVLLPETGYDGAAELAERLRAETASHPVTTSAGDLDITVSIGIALAAPGQGGLDSVLERADHALYQAKRNGRNRCERVDTGADAAAVTA